ncbi:MAG: hypothetical protein ACRCX8_05115 [Sarcina sp.]
MRYTLNSRKTKCKRCGEASLCFKDTYKGVNICEKCIDEYKKSRISCTVCRKGFERDEEYYVDETLKTKNFCSEKCYTNFKSELTEKDNMDAWLKEYFKVEKLPSRIYMQMDDFKNKKGISYRWTFATLRYLVNVKGDILQDGTIGLVPYMVDECKDHVRKLNEISKNAKEYEHCRAKFTDNVITIKSIDINKERDKVVNKKTITEKDLEGVVLW